MKNFFKGSAALIAGTVILLIVAAVVSVGGGLINLEYMKFFGTRVESVKTDIYRENKSYIEGTRRDLREMMLKYVEAETEEHKSALRSLILHRAGELDRDRLPKDLRTFIESLEAR